MVEHRHGYVRLIRPRIAENLKRPCLLRLIGSFKFFDHRNYVRIRPVETTNYYTRTRSLMFRTELVHNPTKFEHNKVDLYEIYNNSDCYLTLFSTNWDETTFGKNSGSFAILVHVFHTLLENKIKILESLLTISF